MTTFLPGLCLKFLSETVTEVGDAQDSVGLLNRKLREAQTAHLQIQLIITSSFIQDWLRSKSRLEHDLTIKKKPKCQRFYYLMITF